MCDFDGRMKNWRIASVKIVHFWINSTGEDVCGKHVNKGRIRVAGCLLSYAGEMLVFRVLDFPAKLTTKYLHFLGREIMLFFTPLLRLRGKSSLLNRNVKRQNFVPDLLSVEFVIGYLMKAEKCHPIVSLNLDILKLLNPIVRTKQAKVFSRR